MRSLLAGLLALGVVGLLGCDGGDHHHHHDDDSSGDVACASGVAIDLGTITDRFAKQLPIAVHVCFDADCDDLQVLALQGVPRCEGGPGGPSDQLTSCVIDSRSADVTIDIARIDGADYSDGALHTIAVSIEDGSGNRLYSYATQTDLGSDGQGCYVADVTVPFSQ